MHTEEQKETIINMKKENHTWGTIAAAIKKQNILLEIGMRETKC